MLESDTTVRAKISKAIDQLSALEISELLPLLCPIESKFSILQLTNSVGLPFRDILPESEIREALTAEKIEYRNRLFNPIVTIWAFLSQVLDSDQSLQNAVSRVIAWLANAEQATPSTDTGGYSKARKRLPERLLLRLLEKTADGLEEQTEPEDLWCGRHVKLCDGSSVLISDTPENQTEYPQHANQKVYPKAKLAQLYQWRWQVEVDLRHVKTTLSMEMLRAKTPEMVRKEIYVHLMVYNLLRTLIWEAAKKAGVCPLRISLQGTRQHLRNFISKLAEVGVRKRFRLYRTLLEVVTDKLLPERPYRYEPRLKKRRPKAYGWMQQPRDVLKCKLAA